MKIIIQSPHFQAKQSLLAFVHEKVQRLASLSDSIQEVRVTLKLNNNEPGESKMCEMRVVIPGNDVFAEKKADSFDGAVLKALEVIKRQIVDRKVRT
jgi:ribosomal subunit interface protein